MTYIRSSKVVDGMPAYQFIQVARCKHCIYYYAKRDGRGNFICWCHYKRCSVSLKGFSCDCFSPNSKYVIANQYVQLNLFDHA